MKRISNRYMDKQSKEPFEDLAHFHKSIHIKHGHEAKLYRLT